jgi:hypothetical protein
MTRRSRLSRKQKAKNIRQAVIYGSLIFLIALGIVIIGIPLLIRVAIFVGDLRQSSQPVENKDTLPPPPPILKPLPEATNSAQIDLHGFSEPSATTEIFVTGQSPQKVIADKEGAFSLNNLALTIGKNEIHAVATDKAGNASQESEKLTIFFDQTPPELEILEPKNNDEFFGNQNQVTVKGKTESKATAYINDHLVIVDREGNFEYPISLEKGENKIKIVAVSKSGNQTEKEIKLNYSP